MSLFVSVTHDEGMAAAAAASSTRWSMAGLQSCRDGGRSSYLDACAVSRRTPDGYRGKLSDLMKDTVVNGKRSGVVVKQAQRASMLRSR